MTPFMVLREAGRPDRPIYRITVEQSEDGLRVKCQMQEPDELSCVRHDPNVLAILAQQRIVNLYAGEDYPLLRLVYLERQRGQYVLNSQPTAIQYSEDFQRLWPLLS